MIFYLLVIFGLPFLLVFFFTKFWIRKARENGLVERDVHKRGVKCAGLGGLPVMFGFVVTLLFIIFIDTFVDGDGSVGLPFVILLSMLIAFVIGLMDDLLGWKRGINKWLKFAFPVIAALPIVVVDFGNSWVTLPFFGPVNLGLFFTFILIPVGISGACNGFNIIGGFNGLEAYMGLVIVLTQSLILLFLGSVSLASFGFVMVACLVAFLCFNVYPAKIFPGDSLTLSVGCLIAILAILGNIEKVSLLLFIPYFIQGVLKLRGRLVKESFGRLLGDGSLGLRYDKFFGLEHVAIFLCKKFFGRCYERQVVCFVVCFQALVAVLVGVYFMVVML